MAFSSTELIRRIFREAFTAGWLPAFNPHSFRKTLALFADELDLTREEEKAWSQKLGHQSVRTTRESYGTLPEYKQTAVMQRLTGRADDAPVTADDLETVRALLKRMEKRRAA